MNRISALILFAIMLFSAGNLWAEEDCGKNPHYLGGASTNYWYECQILNKLERIEKQLERIAGK